MIIETERGNAMTTVEEYNTGWFKGTKPEVDLCPKCSTPVEDVVLVEDGHLVCDCCGFKLRLLEEWGDR